MPRPLASRLTSASARVRDQLLGAPGVASPEQLQRMLRHGSSGLRIQAIREIGARREPAAAPTLRGLLADGAPGARRSAAWGLGELGAAEDAAPLLALARRERCDAVRLAAAAAAARCGADPAAGWAALAAASAREMATWYGPRRTGEATGVGPDAMARRWALALGAGGGDPAALAPLPSAELRESARAILDKDPENRPALLALAAQQHPHDLDLLLQRQAGRRARHAVSEALGVHGDPRAVPALRATLRAIDVDPGQGFAGRRLAGEALGRIGDPGAGPLLARALEDEALDYEGRPGAGLGVQFPVRSVLLVAFGEAGARAQAGLLAGYLSNTHGSALGGFYLPAMDALWKIGEILPLLALLRSDEELVVANAVGVLGALGERAPLAELQGDPRARVAAAVRYALARDPL